MQARLSCGVRQTDSDRSVDEAMEGHLGRLIGGEVLPLAQAPEIARSTGGDWRQDACRDSRHVAGCFAGLPAVRVIRKQVGRGVRFAQKRGFNMRSRACNQFFTGRHLKE